MEGMISSEALVIHAECDDLGGCSLFLDNWAKGLAIKLLAATHPMCPSCNEEEETCRHVLGCDEEGRVKALNCTIDLLENWMRTVGKNGPLRNCLTTYARKRGGI